jgi:hypothetical protein
VAEVVVVVVVVVDADNCLDIDQPLNFNIIFKNTILIV